MSREQTEETQTIRYVLAESWLGNAIVGINSEEICALFLGDSTEELITALHQRFPEQNLIEVAQADEPLAAMALAYIAAPDSTPLPSLSLRQGTEFQQRVWHALQTIPHGQTRSYTSLATDIAAPRAVRAVAKACAANPLAVLIPCHRVLAKNGGLTGYRWGVERKAKLLAAEGNNCSTTEAHAR